MRSVLEKWMQLNQKDGDRGCLKQNYISQELNIEEISQKLLECVMSPKTSLSHSLWAYFALRIMSSLNRQNSYIVSETMTLRDSRSRAKGDPTSLKTKHSNSQHRFFPDKKADSCPYQWLHVKQDLRVYTSSCHITLTTSFGVCTVVSDREECWGPRVNVSCRSWCLTPCFIIISK